jgi:excisionase family DNA binding protein
MTGIAMTIDLDTVANALADAVAARLNDPNPTAPTPWLNVEQAATYLGDAPVSRIYDLVQQHKLTAHRDGRRLLFHHDDLDNYLRRTA